MDVSPNGFVACSLFPFFHEYNPFRFDANDCLNYKQITDLRQKMSRADTKELSSKGAKELDKQPAKPSKGFNRLIRRLVDEEEDIKVFHLICQLIDPSVSYRKKPKKKFVKISEILSRYGYSSRIYTATTCMDKFLTLSAFYAQVLHVLPVFQLFVIKVSFLLNDSELR